MHSGLQEFSISVFLSTTSSSSLTVRAQHTHTIDHDRSLMYVAVE